MKRILKLSAIGVLAGGVLMAVLKVVQLTTGSPAYLLLFNFDYVPLVNELRPVWLFGYLFHFVTCIASVIGLYFILLNWNAQLRIWPYVLVYTVGGGALFFLTALSEQPPNAGDTSAWAFWTLGHAIFGDAVAVLVRRWMGLGDAVLR